MADKHEQSREVGSLYVDVSEALSGLKAVQREAREAAKALRELEEAQSKAEGLSLSDETIAKLRDVIHAKEFPKTIEMEGKVTQSISDDIRRCYE